MFRAVVTSTESIPVQTATRRAAFAPRPRAGALVESGIHPQALVATRQGAVPAASICPGDEVVTRARGFQQVIWAGRVHDLDPTGREGRQLPIRVLPGGLGREAENKPTLLAPNQQIAVSTPRNIALFGAETVLCTARSLVHLEGVAQAARGGVNWVLLLTGAADLVRADGLWLASMVPDIAALRHAAPDQAREICATAPGLGYESGLAAYSSHLTELNPDEAALI